MAVVTAIGCLAFIVTAGAARIAVVIAAGWTVALKVIDFWQCHLTISLRLRHGQPYFTV